MNLSMIRYILGYVLAVEGLLIRVCKWRWLEQYALPISMLGAMAASIPVTALMG